MASAGTFLGLPEPRFATGPGAAAAAGAGSSAAASRQEPATECWMRKAIANMLHPALFVASNAVYKSNTGRGSPADFEAR